MTWLHLEPAQEIMLNWHASAQFKAEGVHVAYYITLLLCRVDACGVVQVGATHEAMTQPLSKLILIPQCTQLLLPLEPGDQHLSRCLGINLSSVAITEKPGLGASSIARACMDSLHRTSGPAPFSNPRFML